MIRAACQRAEQAGTGTQRRGWWPLVDTAVYLGTPHQGRPGPVSGCWPLFRRPWRWGILELHSAGITDLCHGSAANLCADRRHLFAAATATRRTDTAAVRVLDDWLVPPAILPVSPARGAQERRAAGAALGGLRDRCQRRRGAATVTSAAMEPADLALLRLPTRLSLHPDGGRIAVAVTRIDVEADGYRSGIWLVDLAAGVTRRFTHGSHDSAPAWSPDGRWLAFLRADGDDAPAQPYLIPADGGEARRVAEHPLGVSDLAWSPDSTRLAYVARVPEPGRYERGPDARPAAKEAPRRLTAHGYRFDGLGFIADRPAQVFVVAVDGEDAPVQLTRERHQFTTPSWTPDSAQVVFASSLAEEEGSLADEVYLAPASGGDVRRITRSTTTATSPVVSDDGLTVFFLGTDDLDIAGRNIGLFSVPLEGSAPPRRLTGAEEWDLHDAHARAVLATGQQGRYALAARRGAVDVVALPDGSGPPVYLTEGDHVISDLSVAGDRIAVVVGSATSPGEVALVGPDGLRVVTDFGVELAGQVSLQPLLELTSTSPDGYPVHGWLVRPSGPGPFPVLLVVHGGPFTQFGYSFFDEAQVYAGAGYAVVLVNPRGSSGYGEAHGRAVVGRFGGPDRDDLLSLLDAALLVPGLDSSRVGVMGGSYGGLMTTWLAAHDGNRFLAAISERALNAWDSFTGSSDIGWWFTDSYVGTDPAEVRAQSPLTYVDRIEMPMLLIHSEQDWRCPLEQAQRLFVSLSRRRSDAELLLFPGEGHELSRSGLPSHRLARFAAVLEWWGRQLRTDLPDAG